MLRFVNQGSRNVASEMIEAPSKHAWLKSETFL
jgi:hypothetical protein